MIQNGGVEKLKRLLTPDEAAKLFRLNPETIKRRIRDREWPYHQFGERALRIDPVEILKLTRKDAR
jgi:excisionase family DNA binding protein